MAGKTLLELGHTEDPEFKHVAVKESVFPFAKFSNTDVILGPEMKSTGEVMGIDTTVYGAFAKSQLAAGTKLPKGGVVFISVKDDDKPASVDIARRLRALGFTLVATGGTHEYLANKSIPAERVLKVLQGTPNIVDRINVGEVALVINTTAGKKEISDSFTIRRQALVKGTPYFTTVEAARMLVGALEAQAAGERSYRPLQEWLKGAPTPSVK